MVDFAAFGLDPPPAWVEEQIPDFCDFEPHQEIATAPDELPEPQPAFDFPRVSVADIYDNPSPQPAFVWAGRIPRGHVTLLGAHGGAGKSMLALQLAVAICLGRDFLGDATERGRVVFFSGEDGAPVIRNRLASIAGAARVNPRQLADSLVILDASNEPALYREVSTFSIKTGEPTPGFHRLAEIVAELRPAIVIIDNASDTFEGSENDRAAVRGFMRQLRQLAAGDNPPAILLLAHIQKQAVGNRGAESYSGSTAWHNSARSRLALAPNKDDPARLILTHEKLNLGPRTAKELNLVRGIGGLLGLDQAVPGMVTPEGTPEPPEDALLGLLAEFNARGEHVSPETSARNNAWQKFRAEADFPKHIFRTGAPVFSALRQIERDGLIAKGDYTANRKTRAKWVLAAKGYHRIGQSAPTAPTAPTYGDGAPDAGPEGVAPTAPTSCAGGMGDSGAQDDGAELHSAPLAVAGPDEGD
jgi:archaellum biogenesis ATPase FlaH